MEDSGNDSQPSKKRAAGVQLSRDNPGLDEDEETSEQQEGGTFKRASDDILASRRIVKVRRQTSSSVSSDAAPPPASNPFATICLAPTTESAPLVEVEANSVKSNETEQVNKSDAKANICDDNAKLSERVVGQLKPELVAEKDKTAEVVDESITKPVGEELAGENPDVATTETGNEVESKKNDKEKDDAGTTTEENIQTASFSSFQQLSSGQNAFSGFAGIGSSNSAFSSGSIPKDGSTTGSGFGASKNGNSSMFGANSQNEGSKLPSMTEVPLETGEENEKAVFTANSVLFEYVDGLWKERGKGELKVNIPTTETRKARLVMRARGNYRLILNASLFPDMKLTDMEKKGVTFACVNSAAEGNGGFFSTIALRFKDASIAEEFKASVMEHKAKASVVLKTPENSPIASEE